MRLAEERPEVAHRPVRGVDRLVRGDVVAVVAERRRVEREEPDRGRARGPGCGRAAGRARRSRRRRPRCCPGRRGRGARRSRRPGTSGRRARGRRPERGPAAGCLDGRQRRGRAGRHRPALPSRSIASTCPGWCPGMQLHEVPRAGPRVRLPGQEVARGERLVPRHAELRHPEVHPARAGLGRDRGSRSRRPDRSRRGASCCTRAAGRCRSGGTGGSGRAGTRGARGGSRSRGRSAPGSRWRRPAGRAARTSPSPGTPRSPAPAARPPCARTPGP